MMLLGAIDWHEFFFVLFALIACVFALAVLFSTSIVRMAFYLVVSLGATSGLFFLAGAEFVGAMQLMIYVGGTLVLLVFGVMLTARDSFVSMKTRGGEWVLSLAVGGGMLLLLLYTAFQVEDWRTPRANLDGVVMADSKSATPIGLAVTGGRIDKNEQSDPVLREGMSGYLLPFEIVSVHLLVVLIGAGYLARTKRRLPGPVLAAEAARIESRKRSTAITGMIYGGVVVNLLLGGACFVAASQIVQMLADAGFTLEQNALYVVGFLFLLNALVLTAIGAWQRWGLYGVVLIAIAQAFVIGASGGWLLGLIAFALLIVPAAALIGAICRGGEGSVCSQMD